MGADGTEAEWIQQYLGDEDNIPSFGEFLAEVAGISSHHRAETTERLREGVSAREIVLDRMRDEMEQEMVAASGEAEEAGGEAFPSITDGVHDDVGVLYDALDDHYTALAETAGALGSGGGAE